MDKEAAPKPLAPPPQAEYQASSAFSAHPISQSGFFSPVTFNVCLAYANFWYAIAQIQTLAEKSQNLMPPLAAIAQPFRVSTSPMGSMRKSGLTTKKCPHC